MKILMSINEASEAFGIGRGRLYELCATDETIPIIKVGSYTKINTKLFQEWLDEKTRKREDI